jgi:acetyltransferase-like isoleucine patch superfamily enzyme
VLRRAARRSIEVARAFRPTVTRLDRGRRRRVFDARARALAAWVGAEVHLDIHPEAYIGRVQLDIWPGSRTEICIGARALVADGVRLSLRGGQLTVGADTDIRRLGTYHVGGQLTIGAGCMLSMGVYVHCAESVTIGDLTLLAEFATVTDSAHLRTPPGVPVQHSTRTAQVTVGSNVWLGAHAIVTSGTCIGDQCFIGGGSVVTRDVPEGWLAAGAPAKAIRQLDVVVE